ncbi:MAG: hypothetical protein GVY22_09685 [Gammaproteobacteria bacterium]|jgi:putative spermidine/putrescine transport system substrate-binding protein|nr:hypothetical protein [Gammaproteobacteria bacterium]
MEKIVVLTGAGISAESGLGTFRDAGGLWAQHAIEDVATPEGFARDPALVHRFYNARRGQAAGASPNAAHDALARLEAQFSGEVWIESMFSPGAAMARSAGVPCLYAAPREGYRAWHGVMCLSRACTGERQDLAYAYMNWWLSGWPGAYIAKQGYYISNPARSRPFLEPDEWGYWYEGQPAERPLPGPDGQVVAQPGETRRGGSYRNRFSHVAVWNTVMSTYDQSVRRWSELVLA